MAAGEVTTDHDLASRRIVLDATARPFVGQLGTTVLARLLGSIGRGVIEHPHRNSRTPVEASHTNQRAKPAVPT